MSQPYRTLAVTAALCAMLAAGCAGSMSQKSTGEHVDDAVVTTKVKTALVQAEQVDAIDVNVSTYKGVVQLSGFVDTESEAEQAELIAARVAGVKRVENKLELKSSLESDS